MLRNQSQRQTEMAIVFAIIGVLALLALLFKAVRQRWR